MCRKEDKTGQDEGKEASQQEDADEEEVPVPQFSEEEIGREEEDKSEKTKS